MTMAKAVVTGTVYRAPQERFSKTNTQILSLVLKLDEREEMLLRVISRRTALADVVSSLSEGDRILVEGRLQITTVKNESGTERKVFEIDANAVELMGGSAPTTSPKANNEEIVKFAQEEFTDELIGEDEIPF